MNTLKKDKHKNYIQHIDHKQVKKTKRSNVLLLGM